MFMLKFSKTYDNHIFTKYQLKPVVEDSFCVTPKAFCVADGVTRDNIYGEAVCYPETKKEAEDWVASYPNPSGADKAANICANQFIYEIANLKENEISKEKILEVVKKVNKKIGNINQNRKIDYLKEDYYCTEAVGGIIVGETLYAFSIGDCHIALLDQNKKIQFETINNHKQFEDYLQNIYCKENPYDWNNKQDRAMVRREFRNNPKKKYEGKEISFGALSGQIEAEHYIDTYEIDLKQIQYICAYSDGCEPIFASQEKIEKIITNPEYLSEEGKERTLVIYERMDSVF